MSIPIEVSLFEGPLPERQPFAIEGQGTRLEFEGIVRPSEAGQPIAGLNYEAYEPMTTRELTKLAEQVALEHGLLAMRVEHSVGHVPNGTCSFRLTLCSKHRKEGIAATDQFIDKMKQMVPLWKNPVTV